jgi:hypothetical protein
MSVNVESGLRQARTEFIRETAFGATPADPDWELFSDEVFRCEWAPSRDIFEKRRLGSVDPDNFFGGSETHQLTLEYYLQRWLLSGGNPLDPLGDAVVRDADNNMGSSLAIVHREEREVSGGISPLDSGERIYTVANGCYAGEITIPGQIESGEPVRPNVVYTCSKVRSYQISQPAASTTISVVSSSALDTTQNVEVENEDAGTSETIGPLTGTTPVVGATSFTDIDSVMLDAECVGDVTLTDGTNTLMVIYGSATYDNIEGDLGVPSLGAGSHGSALATAYEQFIDDTITRGGTALETYINSAEFRVNNNLETFPQLGSLSRIIVPGVRNVELSATVFGPSASHTQIMDHLRVVESDIVWTLTGGTLTLTNAVMRDAPTRNYTAEEVTMSLDPVFVGQGVAVSG